MRVKFGKPNFNVIKISQERRTKMSNKYAKLRGRIKECGYTQEELAREIGRDRSSLSYKLNGKSDFTTKEIDCICKVLDISNNEIGEYFFTI
jgi:putative transcriptional regulator